MDAFIPSIDPLNTIATNINIPKIHTKKDVEKEFMSIFINQMMKNVYKTQNTMFGEENSIAGFQENIYNDILMNKISNDMAASKAFGFDALTGE